MMMDVCPFSSFYLHSPSPEYRQAFNLALNGDAFPDTPILAVMSSAVYAVELLKRCRGPIHFLNTDGLDADLFVTEAQGFAWGPLHAVSVGAGATYYSSIIWAEPEFHSVKSVVHLFNEVAVAGTCLSVIASGPLHRLLPAWQAAPYPASEPLAPGKVVRSLSTAGWMIDRQVAFHGPRSIFWSLLVRAAEWLGRPDWADRALFGMRSTYQEAGWLSLVSPLALIKAHKL